MERSGLSVIIPMLDSEQYIEQCIASVLRQGDIVKEVNCVDNGSKDRTKEIVLRMRESDTRIKYYACETRGVSAARNYGLERAEGEYVLFVDSDDYLQGKKLSKLYDKAVKTDADILVFGGTSTQPLKTPHWVKKVLSPRNNMCEMAAGENIFEERGVLPATWNKLYKTELIKGLRFSEQLRIAEDKLFQFFAFSCAKKVVFVKKRIYVYRMHADSVMNCVDNVEKEKQHKLAMQLARNWWNNDRPRQSMEENLENFTKSFVSKNNQSRGILKLRFYIKEYGLRSFTELMLGRILYKNKL